MKNKKETLIRKFWLFPIIALLFGIWTFMPDALQPSQTVSAGCVIAGKVTHINGTPTCDCTTATESTCGCIVTCTPKGDGDVPAEQVEVS